ncbi:molybdopterin-dependent oxidoreductase [Pseudonocardia benzenivorans]|uniref:Molybdopterin-dependent oxidoreductase n=1 Tax=Pseudonocardia benzenivorans TaxID=228005 RepID=A0ABW3VI24_9PSEU
MTTTAARRPSGSTATPPTIPGALAAGIGVLSVAAAVGAGHLVAGFVSPGSSPYVAVGDEVIRLSPQPLVEFAKSAFGTHDKTVLLVGIAVVMLVVSALAGFASRRVPRPGVVTISVLGLLGLAAVAVAPTFAPLDVIAPAASIAVGVPVFRRLHRLALEVAAERAATESSATDRAATDRAATDRAATDRTASETTGTDKAGAAAAETSGTREDGRRHGGAAEGSSGDGRLGTPATGTPGTRPSGTGKGGGPAVSRRGMLVGTSAAVGIGALLAGAGGVALGRGVGQSRADVTARLAGLDVVRRAPAIPPGADFAAELGTTPFVTANSDFYRIDTALRVPALQASDWSLRIHGMVGTERTLSFDDLMSRPMIEKTVTMTCVSNEVGGSLISTATFVGTPLRDLLTELGVQAGADQIFCTSSDGWTCGTPTDVVMEPDRDAMLVVGMNGEALPPEHGFPVRMVVPGLYGYVSATKWITDMELTTFAAQQGYWVDNGWAQEAPIKTEARIDLPGGFATVPAGQVTVAGIAWSQPRGVSKVEVRMDGGPWQQAALAADVSGATWRMWRTTFDLGPGSHTVQCRATDGEGQTQVEQRADPVPDGATGWPATIFTVR